MSYQLDFLKPEIKPNRAVFRKNNRENLKFLCIFDFRYVKIHLLTVLSLKLLEEQLNNFNAAFNLIEGKRCILEYK